MFYIDEGYYDFRWMKSSGNWIVFSIYFAALFLAQWVVHLVWTVFGKPNPALVSFLGLMVVVGLFLGAFFLI